MFQNYISDINLVSCIKYRSETIFFGRRQYFCKASLVAQMITSPLAMQETQAQSLGWEDPLEEGMAIHSSILAWRIPMDREV